MRKILYILLSIYKFSFRHFDEVSEEMFAQNLNSFCTSPVPALRLSKPRKPFDKAGKSRVDEIKDFWQKKEPGRLTKNTNLEDEHK